MATIYPAQIDNSTSLPDVIDNVSGLNAASVNTVKAAVVAVETALGPQPQGLFTTVRKRLDAIEALIQSAIIGEITFAGDISGTVTHQTVIGLQTRPISVVAPGPGQTLIWDGGSYTPSTNFIAQNLVTTGTLATGAYTLNNKFTINGISAPSASSSGQAILYYDSGSNKLRVSENGGTYVNLVTSDELLWFNVKDYGAIGNGVADDTVPIRNAINAASIIGGKIYIPPTGNYYRVTSAITLPANISLEGDFSQNGGFTNLGSVIVFQGSGTGFIMNGASISIKNLVLFTDPTAGPHILQPTAGSAFGLWQFENVRLVCENPNKGAIVLGSGAGDGYGVENNWSTFSRLDILAASAQAVPLIQLYGQGGGLSNLSFRDCVWTGGGLVGSGSESLAEFVHVESTDSGLIVNMEFHNISFEIPYHGAIVFKSVSDSKITNCWAGDLTGYNPATALISVSTSSHGGAQPSRNILIDTLFTDIGNNVAGQETVDVPFGGGPVILLNSKIPSINAHGYGPGIINEGSAIGNVVGGTDLIPGTNDAGFIRAQVSQIAEGSIILRNDLNSDASPGIYTGFAYVTTTAIRPIYLGGLTLGAYGAGTEFTLYHNHTQPLIIVNEDLASTATYRITTQTDGYVVAGNSCVVKFIYDGQSNRWILKELFNANSGTNSTLNVKTIGALGDGVADDSAAIQATLNLAPNICYLPKGTYKINSTINLNTPNIIMKGDGIDITTISAGTASMTMLGTSASCKRLILEDMTIDYNTLGFFCVLFDGVYFESATFRRCKFTGTAVCNITFFDSGGNNITYEDCVFDAQGKCNANGIVLIGSMTEILVSQCSFRGLLNGISIQPGTNNTAISKVIIEKSYFDFMYYTAPALDGYANSGGTVSYTSSTLTDTSKTFIISSYGTIRKVNQYGIIRALTSLATGTITSINKTQLIDSGGSFLSLGLVKGDIVKTSSTYAIVKNVDSNTVINIEGWLDGYTAVPLSNATGSYTVYRVAVGKIGDAPGNVGYTITLYNNWLDLYGNVASTPAPGTLYEIVPQSNYPMSAQTDAEQVKIINNVFLRGLTDQVSPFGNYCEVAGNIIEDGQDMGITIDGTTDGYGGRHIVHDNLIIRHGTSGIFLGQAQCNIHDNQIYGWGTRQHALDTGTGAIECNPAGTLTLIGGQIHNNIMDGYGYPLAGYGIDLAFGTGLQIYDNQVRNVQLADMNINGATGDNFIRHNTGSINYGGGTPGQISYLYGTGSPLNVVKAAVGSVYFRTDGISNATLYIKENGTGSTGWTNISDDTVVNLTNVTTNYNVLSTDNIIAVGTLSSSITITLEASPQTGRKLIIKDAVGGANTYNIVISGNGHNIDGSSSITLDQNYAAIDLVWTGSGWIVL